MTRPRFRCVIHGSIRKHLREMGEAMTTFRNAGIDVLAPNIADIVCEDDGFLFFRGEERSDPRMIELLYLQKLRELGENGFSYFVNPHGYIGKSVAYELGIAQATNVPCYFLAPLADHPAYIGKRSVWQPEDLAAFIERHGRLPQRTYGTLDKIERLWRQMVIPNSVVSAGAIIEYQNDKRGNEREILLVRTHKWHDRFSVVGGKVRHGERLDMTLRREVKEETGLDGIIGRHLCTFDQIRHSGYYDTSVQHLFVDNIFRVDSKRVVLNNEAQEFVWMPARQALTELPIEPNARHTIEIYANTKRA